jgi:hypothetical protein
VDLIMSEELQLLEKRVEQLERDVSALRLQAPAVVGANRRAIRERSDF